MSETDWGRACQAVADGVILGVIAQPKSRRSGLVGLHDGRLKVAVTAPADRGQANEAIAGLLAGILNIAPSRIRLIRGATSRRKDLLVSGLDASDAVALLSAATDS